MSVLLRESGKRDNRRHDEHDPAYAELPRGRAGRGSRLTAADITAGNFDGIGTQEFVDRQVRERKGRSAQELADELANAANAGQAIIGALDDTAWAGPAPGGLDFPMGEGVEAVWYDTYVHGEDIRAALGRPATKGPGVKASVSHLADLLTRAGWGPATLALDGLPDFPVGGGGGQRVEGDPLQFVLVATGRAEPASMGLDEKVNVYR